MDDHLDVATSREAQRQHSFHSSSFAEGEVAKSSGTKALPRTRSDYIQSDGEVVENLSWILDSEHFTNLDSVLFRDLAEILAEQADEDKASFQQQEDVAGDSDEEASAKWANQLEEQPSAHSTSTAAAVRSDEQDNREVSFSTSIRTPATGGPSAPSPFLEGVCHSGGRALLVGTSPASSSSSPPPSTCGSTSSNTPTSPPTATSHEQLLLRSGVAFRLWSLFAQTTVGKINRPVWLDEMNLNDEAPSDLGSSTTKSVRRTPSRSTMCQRMGSLHEHRDMNSLTSRLLRGIESSRAWYRLIPPEVRSAVEANVNEKTFPSLVSIKKDRGVAGAGFGRSRTEDSELLLLTKYAWAAKLAHFQKYGGFSYSERNQVEILESGDVGFPVMLDAIGRAKERVWLESYIFDDSGIAERFVDALAAAKSRGVREVVVVVDGIGSREMKPEHVARLEATGVKVVVFNPPGVRSVLFGSGVAEASSMQRPLTQQLHSEHPDNYEYNFLHPWPLRDHRKILICDEVGFCGSLNVMREDCGPELGGIGGFYDVHVKLQGPAVKDLGDVFLDSLAEAGEESFASGLGEIQIARIDAGNHVGDAEDDELSTTDRHGDKNENDNSTSAEKKKKKKKKLYVQVVRSNMRLRARNRSLQKVLTKSLYGALHSIHITTPYFFPPLFLRRSLWKQLRSVDNGVKMSFLLSGVSDVSPIPYDTLGQKHVIRKLLVEERRRKDRLSLKENENNHPEPEDRLSVYLSEHEHMHAKIVVVDTLFATVGSFNFDWFSGRRNLEVGLCIFDHELAKEFEALHRRKLLENRQSDGGEKQRQEGPAPRAELHTWFGVPLHGGDLPQERQTGTALTETETASPTSSMVAPPRKTVRRQHLDQWEYSNIFPRAVSFWAYNSVWFASCNIWDGLDHVTALKRRMRAVREEARREREILFDVVRGYVRNGNITSNTTTLSGAHRRNMQMATRMAAEDEAAIRTETERRVRAEERLAFVQMMNGVHIV